ncbi:MAG: DUF4258 domain-containing protein [Candidatus Omnitrophica bacterium]|nr:DUF4258 domain-containing protein [Candidatus Omnitrophota bacterium]
MKKIRFSKHAIDQMIERGASEEEVCQTILRGEKIPAKKGRSAYRFNFQYGRLWSGKYYHTKQVMPVIVEEPSEIVVVTVYTFYF